MFSFAMDMALKESGKNTFQIALNCTQKKQPCDEYDEYDEQKKQIEFEFYDFILKIDARSRALHIYA